jgi:hypothetical protein
MERVERMERNERNEIETAKKVAAGVEDAHFTAPVEHRA